MIKHHHIALLMVLAYLLLAASGLLAQTPPKLDCKLLGGRAAKDGHCILPPSTTIPGRVGDPAPLPSRPPTAPQYPKAPQNLEEERLRAGYTSTTTWRWTCEANAFEYCDASTEFIADPTADLCEYRMTDNSVTGDNPYQPPTVTELPGGIKIQRFVEGSAWGAQGRFDAIIEVTVVSKALPPAKRALICKGNISGIKRAGAAPPNWRYINYCGSSDNLPSGWLLAGFTHEEKCSSLGQGNNASTGLQEVSVSSGETVLVCWQQDAPNGWDDLGIQAGDGSCGQSKSGVAVNQRKIRKH